MEPFFSLLNMVIFGLKAEKNWTIVSLGGNLLLLGLSNRPSGRFLLTHNCLPTLSHNSETFPLTVTSVYVST